MWNHGDIVAIQFDDDLEWGYVRSYNHDNDRYLIRCRDGWQSVESARITGPYPAPSQVIMKGFTLDEFTAKIDEILMSRVK